MPKMQIVSKDDYFDIVKINPSEMRRQIKRGRMRYLDGSEDIGTELPDSPQLQEFMIEVLAILADTQAAQIREKELRAQREAQLEKDYRHRIHAHEREILVGRAEPQAQLADLYIPRRAKRVHEVSHGWGRYAEVGAHVAKSENGAPDGWR